MRTWWKKSGTPRPSSAMVLFKQSAFEAYFANFAWDAHLRAMAMAIYILTAMGIATVLAPQYWNNWRLLQSGLEVKAAIQDVSLRRYTKGKSNRDVVNTTFAYAFKDKDGREHRGTSSLESSEDLGIGKGWVLKVLYDPVEPKTNRWITTLNAEQNEAIYVGLLLLALFPLVALYLYRYTLWIRSRRRHVSSTVASSTAVCNT